MKKFGNGYGNGNGYDYGNGNGDGGYPYSLIIMTTISEIVEKLLLNNNT